MIFFRTWMDRAVGPIHYFGRLHSSATHEKKPIQVGCMGGPKGCRLWLPILHLLVPKIEAKVICV